MSLILQMYVCMQEAPPLNYSSQAQKGKEIPWNRKKEMKSRCCVCTCVVWVFFWGWGGGEHGSWVTPGIQPHLTLINWPGVLHLSTGPPDRKVDHRTAQHHQGWSVLWLSFFVCLASSLTRSLSQSLSVSLSLSLCVSALAVSRWRRHTPVSFAKLAQITQAHPKWLTMVGVEVGVDIMQFIVFSQGFRTYTTFQGERQRWNETQLSEDLNKWLRMFNIP